MKYAASCPADCAYRSAPTSKNPYAVTCDYILIEGHSRGRDPKPYCARYRKRGEKRRPDPDTVQLSRAQDRQTWDHEKGFRLYKLGMTTKQIAAELGISWQAVHGRRNYAWNKGRP